MAHYFPFVASEKTQFAKEEDCACASPVKCGAAGSNAVTFTHRKHVFDGDNFTTYIYMAHAVTQHANDEQLGHA